MAAPAVPKPKVKMNSGSSPMFKTPPVAMPTMASAALPSPRRMLFITKDAHITGAAYRM